MYGSGIDAVYTLAYGAADITVYEKTNDIS